jgi:hypothetical protein
MNSVQAGILSALIAAALPAAAALLPMASLQSSPLPAPQAGAPAAPLSSTAKNLADGRAFPAVAAEHFSCAQAGVRPLHAPRPNLQYALLAGPLAAPPAACLMPRGRASTSARTMRPVFKVPLF